MTAARVIAGFAADLRLDDVPPAVREAACLHLIDAIGVGLASSVGEGQRGWPAAMSAGGRIATCLSGGQAGPNEAAMLNGALIHALEYDDTHTASVIHGSAVAAPVALAAAEAEQASGADLLLNYVIAWEVMICIGLAAPGIFQARGFQVTAIAGAIGAAAAAARQRGLPAESIAHAIGIAGSQASGLLAFLEDGSSVKALNPGWAAQTGIMAASLAASGMTGPAGVLDGPMGVMQVFAGQVGDLSEQTAKLGHRWHLPDAAFKLYPCCHYIHPFLEATEQLMAQGVRAYQVDSITVDVAAGQVPLICEPWTRRQAPSSGYDGKWGLAYCIALMLQTGKVDVASFETTPKDAVIALARRIDWRVMKNAKFPQVFPAHMAVKTAEGASLSATIEDVRGTSKRPVGTDRIETKFMQNALRRLPEGTCRTLLAMLTNICDAPDLSALSTLLRMPIEQKPLAFSQAN